MSAAIPEIDPKLDLVLERTVDVSPSLIWKCWTEPKHLTPWFCPKPWRTTKCEIDLRPGGRFYTRMEGPEGEAFDNMGCYLEVVKDRRLVWTSALLPGYRPAPPGGPLDFPFTAFLLLEPAGSGTKYTAIALHKDEANAKQHADMGFQDGWGTVVEQLVEYAKGL